MRTLLMILDGWGLTQPNHVSAIIQAETPFFDRSWSHMPHLPLEASGKAVGLPEGQMGNSEVGHTHIGAGRVVYQDLWRINEAIASGAFFKHPPLSQQLEALRQRGGSLHLVGLLSRGGVHAHTAHLEALARTACQAGISSMYLHAFLDGRDMPPFSARELLKKQLPRLANFRLRLCTLIGRYYAMDRDQRWQRTAKAYDALVRGKATAAKDPLAVLETAYDQGIGDEFLPPYRFSEAKLAPADLILCFNYRPDRMRQLLRVLTKEAIEGMKPIETPVITLTRYDKHWTSPLALYDKEIIKNTLGECLADAGLNQIRAAETEKYPHVTYFFSGGREEPFLKEERILVPSPKVATYDLQPAMSAIPLTQAILACMKEQKPDFICLNYANPDMVGHSGVFDAVVKACEVTDSCASRVATAAQNLGYHVLIIADHGNAECMRLPDGSPHTAHTTSPVPCILLPAQGATALKPSSNLGTLRDVAPTLLHLMNLTTPPEMDGVPLFV